VNIKASAKNEKSETTITIFNALGAEVYKNTFIGNVSTKLDLNKKSKGMYTVQLIRDGKISSKKFIIE
jgi:hypothetical protein